MLPQSENQWSISFITAMQGLVFSTWVSISRKMIPGTVGRCRGWRQTPPVGCRSYVPLCVGDAPLRLRPPCLAIVAVIDVVGGIVTVVRLLVLPLLPTVSSPPAMPLSSSVLPVSLAMSGSLRARCRCGCRCGCKMLSLLLYIVAVRLSQLHSLVVPEM